MRYRITPIYVTIFFCWLALITISYAGWERTYGWIYDEVVYSLEITGNKDYIIAGYARDSDYSPKYFYLMKVGDDGDSMWARTYIEGEAHDVKQTADGGFIASGYNNLDEEYYLLKINTDGSTIWTSSITECPWSTSNSSIVQAEDGDYVVVWRRSPDFHDFFVARTNPYGDTIWTRRIGRELNDYANCIVEASDGKYIIVGGTSIETSSEVDVYIVQIDSLGEMVWDTCYGGTGRNDAYFISATDDGYYIIVGRTSLYYDILFDVYLLKINDSGDTLWTRKIGGEDESDIGRCVRPTTDGGYIIVGYTYSYGIGTPDSSNVYLVKTDSEGYVEWEHTYGGPGEDKGYSVSQTDDGGYIIAGVYDQGPHTDVYLIKTDSLGNVDWIREPGMKPQEISMNVYPNPFNSSCQITVDVGAFRETPLQIEIFDLRGNLVGALNLTPLQNGAAIWQPDEEIGSGIYLVRATVGEKTTTKRIVLIR